MLQHRQKKVICVVVALLVSATAVGCAAKRDVREAPVIDCSGVADPSRLPDGRNVRQVYDSLYLVVVTSGQATPLKLNPLVPFTSPPKLANAPTVESLLKQLYPPALRDAGLGGKAMITLLVHTDGSVTDVRIARGSGYIDLDRATVEIGRALRFRPARNRDCAIPFFIQMPITWMVERSSSPSDPRL